MSLKSAERRARPDQHRLPASGRAAAAGHRRTRGSPSATRIASAAATSRCCSPAPIRPSCSAPRSRWSSRCGSGRSCARRASPATCRRPEITITPRLDLMADHGRHHRRDEPGDPRRHPGRDRPGQRPLLAVRSPGADPGRAQRRLAPQPLDDREHAGADRQRRLGAAEGRRRDQLRRGPLGHPADQSGAPDHGRRRPRRGRRRRRRRSSTQLPIMQNLPGGRRARPLRPAARGSAAHLRVPDALCSRAPSSSSRCWCCSTRG